MNIFLTILIISIAIVSIWFVWSKDIDYLEFLKSKAPKIPIIKEIPKIEYATIQTLASYTPGSKVDGLLWRFNYSKHLLTVGNSSSEDLTNTIISLSLPAGIVSSKIESSVNVFNVNMSSFNQPISLGKTKFENTISNSIDISIEKLNKHSTVTISLILDYRNKPKECWNSNQCFWLSDISYQYEKKKETKDRVRHINPRNIVSEKRLSLLIDKSKNYVNQANIKGTRDIYPISPIVSLPNGAFKQVNNFDGRFKNLKLNKGEGLLNSVGLDYTINTDQNYR